MQIRDRIRELRRVKASQLRPNPRNWRTHPANQRDALRGVLAEVGYADALLVRELSDGSLELIDGHLRAETTPDVDVPVLIVDVTEEEANLILATHDPLTAMAETDDGVLKDLLEHVETSNHVVRELLHGQLAIDRDVQIDESLNSKAVRDEPHFRDMFQVVVECEDEEQQRDLYTQLSSDGYKCRVLTM